MMHRSMNSVNGGKQVVVPLEWLFRREGILSPAGLARVVLRAGAWRAWFIMTSVRAHIWAAGFERGGSAFSFVLTEGRIFSTTDEHR